MSDQSTEQLVIEAVLKDLVTKEAARVSTSLKGIGTQVEDMGKKAEAADIGAGMAKSLIQLAKTSAGVLGVGLSLHHVIEAADEFETSMHGVVLRIEGGVESIESLKNAVRSISSETGISTTKLAAGGADVLRVFGRDGSQAITILEEVSRTARIAGQDEAATFGQVASVLDGYKLQAQDARDVSEQLFSSALQGKATFGELASTMSTLAPLAKALGFDFRQTAAVLTAMAPDAGGVVQAGTALHTLFGRLLADKQLQQRLQAVGSGFDADAKAGNSLVGVLRGLQDATGGSQSELTGLLGGARGAAAAMALTSTDTSKLDAAFNALARSAGEVDQKVRALENLPEEKWDRLKNKVAVFVAELGKVPTAVRDALVSVAIPDEAAPGFLQNITGSLRNAKEQMKNAVSLGDEGELKKWVEEYQRLAEAAKFAGVAQEAGVQSLASLASSIKDTRENAVALREVSDGVFDVFIEKAHKVAEIKASYEDQAKAAELLIAIQSKTMTGLEQEAVQHDLIYSRIEKEISAYEDVGVNVQKLRAALNGLRTVDAERQNLAATRERLSLDQQLAGQIQKTLEVEQQRARALGDFNRAEELGEQILVQRARAEGDAAETVIAGLMEQRRIYPQLASAIDEVIGKVRERQFVEGQQARAAMDQANSDALDKALEAQYAAGVERNKAAQEAATRAFEAEHQLQVLRADGLTGLERELAQIEANHEAEIRKAQDEAAADEEKAKRLGNLILLIDAQTERERLAAQQAQLRRDMEDDQLRIQQAMATRRASGGERMDAIFGAEALRRFKDDGVEIQDTLDELHTSAYGIGIGFSEGWNEGLRAYADSAQRALESGMEMIRSFHDEGSRSLSDLLKGNLSGGDALRQFGQGVLGTAIDQSSSRIFDQISTSLFGAGNDIETAGKQAAGSVQGAGGILSGALQGIGAGIGGILSSIFGGGFNPVGPNGPIPQAEGGVWGGTLLPIRAAGGGVFGRRTLLEVAEVAGRQEAVVPMHRGGIMADMTTSGPRVRVAGADIPLSIRGSRSGTTVNVAPTANVSLTVNALDPRGAAEAVLAQMPQIQKAITSALVRGSDRQLRDAIQGAAR